MNGHAGRPTFRLSNIARLLVTIGLVLLTIAPLYWLVTLSTLTNAEVVSDPPSFLPNLGRFGPISEQTGDPIGTWLFNSVVVAIAVSVISITLAIFPACS